MKILDRIAAVVGRELRLFWRDICWLYAAILRWWRDRYRREPAVIDTMPPRLRDEIERAWASAIQTRAAIDRDNARVSTAIWIWACRTTEQRKRAVIDFKHPRDLPLREWLNGLGVIEIGNLKAAGAFAIMHHVFEIDRIAGVREVQPLPPSKLIFPRPIPRPDDLWASITGGGPRVKRVRM